MLEPKVLLAILSYKMALKFSYFNLGTKIMGSNLWKFKNCQLLKRSQALYIRLAHLTQRRFCSFSMKIICMLLSGLLNNLLHAQHILTCSALVSLTSLHSTIMPCAKIDQEARVLASDSSIWRVSSEENRIA